MSEPELSDRANKEWDELDCSCSPSFRFESSEGNLLEGQPISLPFLLLEMDTQRFAKLVLLLVTPSGPFISPFAP